MSQAGSSSGKWAFRLVALAAIVAGGWYAAGYVMRPVAQVIPAARGKAVDSRPGTVEVKAGFDVSLKSEVGGRVKTNELEIGRRVFKGDVLVTLDSGDVDIDIDRIKNDLAAAKKKFEIGSTLVADELTLKASFEERERQMKAGNYPAIELDKDRRNYQQAVQRRQLDEVNLKLAVDTLESSLKAKLREKTKMTIVAPTDSVVTGVIARVGDLIGGNSPIATLISVTRTIEAKLSEDNFAAIKLGQRASVRFLTFGDEYYPATISKVLPSADVTTQRYSVYLDVVMPEGKVLMPGLTGEVGIVIAEREHAIVVPRRALVGNYVYVVKDGRVELREVQKGFNSENLIEILKGVEVGEAVIVEQQDLFSPGDRVRTKVLDN